MRVLVACEESQEVCKAFRALGHEAYSCDVEWREIPGFPNYEASSAGEIRSKERVVQYSDGRKRLYKSAVLSPTLSAGYKSVKLKTMFLLFQAVLTQKRMTRNIRGQAEKAERQKAGARRFPALQKPWHPNGLAFDKNTFICYSCIEVIL